MIKVGFSRVDITPVMGIDISGYYMERKADGVLDNLEINALALESNGKKALMLSADLIGLEMDLLERFIKNISAATGVPEAGIYIACTHTHTGPSAADSGSSEAEVKYTEFLAAKAVDAATFAIADLKDAKMGFGIGNAPKVAFVRRFRMKDGSIQTNPGVNNPNIAEPIGQVDERVNVVRFDRPGAETIVLVNFGNHPDVVGGCKISADWPGFLRKYVEKAIDNTKCVFFNGAQGDVNHVNVHPEGGYLNDLFMDFDDVARGYAHSKYIGRVVTGGVLQAYDKVKYVDVEDIQFVKKMIKIPSAMPDKKDLPEAYRIKELHEAGKDSELPYKGMMLTTVVAEALRMVRLENGPEAFEMPLTGIALGPIAFIGIPGEPFTGIGLGLKASEAFELVLPTCLTNGSEGYFPMKEAYDEGGYEARSSHFKAGVAERIISEGIELLKELKR